MISQLKSVEADAMLVSTQSFACTFDPVCYNPSCTKSDLFPDKISIVSQSWLDGGDAGELCSLPTILYNLEGALKYIYTYKKSCLWSKFIRSQPFALLQDLLSQRDISGPDISRDLQAEAHQLCYSRVVDPTYLALDCKGVWRSPFVGLLKEAGAETQVPGFLLIPYTSTNMLL